MKSKIAKPDKKVLEEIVKIGTGTACGTLMKMGFYNTFANGIKSFVTGKKLVGTAITVRYVPIREDLLKNMPSNRSEWPDFKALEMVEQGDVVVCDASHGGNATFGDIMVTRLRARGGAGIVVDGAIRDIPILRKMDVPVFARETHAAPGPKTILPLEINVPIQCGGITVTAGDVILGDDDGIVVVPKEIASQVAKAGIEEEDLESFISKHIWNTPIAEFYPPSEKTKKAYEESKKKTE